MIYFGKLFPFTLRLVILHPRVRYIKYPRTKVKEPQCGTLMKFSTIRPQSIPTRPSLFAAQYGYTFPSTLSSIAAATAYIQRRTLKIVSERVR